MRRSMVSALVQDEVSGAASKRFPNLRGVRWRIDLGVLPGSPSASIDDLRRVTADTRRRYANLRRRLLIEHNLPKDGDVSPDLAVDNPLSQNPDSTWGRFFKNAELGKTLEQDLSRLYPEHQGYFHAPLCQAMLKRILLLWCLQHPEYGYRQGMHELLAPLVYVLHVDLDHLFQVQKVYEDCFNDEFDGLSSPETDMLSNYRMRRVRNWESGIEAGSKIVGQRLDELDPDIRDIFLLSDSYGAEGELGVILSKRFVEHDAYCMFENLMNGPQGGVAMASFFSPVVGSGTNLPPVIEASKALYHLLCIVDFSLHNHLVELGVEPQYFALRWLRVLFGREFCLDDLLVIWDELFSASNSSCIGDGVECNFKILNSPRGALIVALAVSMLLYLRSSLLAAETATTCLQRLVNFPENPNTKKLIERAKSLQTLALESDASSFSPQRDLNKNKIVESRRYSLTSASASASPMTSLNVVADSYWEEKWSVLHKDTNPNRTVTDRSNLSRTQSEPIDGKFPHSQSSVRRMLFDNSSSDDIKSVEDCVVSDGYESPTISNLNVGEDFPVHSDDKRTSNCIGDGTVLSEDDDSFQLPTSTSPLDMASDHENESEKSSETANSFYSDKKEEQFCNQPDNSDAIDTGVPDEPKQPAVPKEGKPLVGRFQWFWKFGRGSSEVNQESQQSLDTEYRNNKNDEDSTAHEGTSVSCGVNKRAEAGDKKVMDALRSIGQSMLENVQVIETAFQQEKGKFDSLDNLSNNILGGKGQNTAISALKELRKISNLLQQM